MARGFRPGWNRSPAANGVDISAELSQAADAIGSCIGVVAEMRTKRFVSDVIEATWRTGAAEFNTTMDVLAATNPKKFHHVYEWGMVGLPAGRLWNVVPQGLGAHKTLSFKFRPSVKAIPEPKAGLAPVKNMALTGAGGPYRFAAKAAVMEFGIPVVIKPRDPEGKIFIPFPQGYEPGIGQGMHDDRGFMFVDMAVVKNPGGPVAGNFSTAWVTFWETQGQSIFDRKIRPNVSKAVRQITGSARMKKGASKTSFTLLVDASAATAAASMRAQAKNFGMQELLMSRWTE